MGTRARPRAPASGDFSNSHASGATLGLKRTSVARWHPNTIRSQGAKRHAAAILTKCTAKLHPGVLCAVPSQRLRAGGTAHPSVQAARVREAAHAAVGAQAVVFVVDVAELIHAVIDDLGRVAAAAHHDVVVMAVSAAATVGAAVPAKGVVAVVAGEADAVAPAKAHVPAARLAVRRPGGQAPVVAAIDVRIRGDAELALGGVRAVGVRLFEAKHLVQQRSHCGLIAERAGALDEALCNGCLPLDFRARGVAVAQGVEVGRGPWDGGVRGGV
mmetsp:Transcript_25314/g.73006  ORF Transcript_25314/g.73006 Transcript_25314/m.73006 type:complete len:272 (+) Transcript_25314:136-951(+)